MTCFVIVVTMAVAQEHSDLISETKQKISESSDNDSEASLTIDLAKYFRENSVDSSLVYFDKATELIDTAQNSPLTAKYFYWLGEHYYITGESEKAWLALSKAEASVRALSSEISLGVLMNKMAGVKIRLGKNDEAIPLLLSAIEELTTSEDTATLANAYNSMGTVMDRTKRPEEALEYYQKAYDTAVDAGDLRLAYGILSNVAMMHSLNGEHRKALPLFRQIIEYGEEKGELRTTALGYTNTAAVYDALNQLDSAEQASLKAVKIFRELNNPRGVAASSSLLSKIYRGQSRNREAVNLLLPQYEIVKKNKFRNFETKIVENLMLSYRDLKDYENAYHFSTLHAALKDSTLNETIANTVNDAEVRYQTLEKEAEIQRLALEDQLNHSQISKQRTALIGTIIGLGILSFFLYRNFSQKRKIENQKSIIQTALTEKESLLKEIHHRVKNNLQVISSLLKLQSRSVSDENTLKVLDEGQNRVRSMALIHQNLYMQDNLSGIHMPKYIDQMVTELIDNYSLNGETVKRKLDIEELHLDVDTVVPIGLIMNEMITNSLKYAFEGIQEPTITIIMYEQEDGLFMQIRDNGSGFDPDQASSEQLGMQLVRSFAKRLNASYDLDTSEGTSASFLIKDYKLIA